MPETIRRYKVRKNADEVFELNLASPDLKAEGLHLQTWGSSYVLANLLHRLDVPITTSKKRGVELSEAPRVLELGAGTGLVGLSAAMIWNRMTILTDLAPIMPGIVANMRLNKSLMEQHGDNLTFASALDWKEPTHVKACMHAPCPFRSESWLDGNPQEGDKATVILAADTMYADEHPQLLSGAIFQWLRRAKETRAIVCYPMRPAYLDVIREFWTRLEEGGLEVLQEGREELNGTEEECFDDEKLHEWSVWKWRDL